MKCLIRSLLVAGWLMSALPLWAAPLIDPLPPVSIPAGKSLIIPVTATSPNGRPLTYTVTSSTNRIGVIVHTNNPFWRMSVVQVAPPGSPGAYQTTYRGATVLVTNVGDMIFMLFRDRAPRTVDVFTGFSHSGFYNSNTIFHRVITNFMIQGGDPATNGTGGPGFQFDDEFHPQAILSGNGQLAMANSGKDSNGSQFFVTFGPQRHLDFNHTVFGQLLRGQAVQTNIANTPRGAGDRPLRDVIIQRAGIVTNTTDTVVTLTGTNLAGVSGIVRVIADDGAGGRTTNTFTATTVADLNNAPPFLVLPAITNLLIPVNGRITNFISALDLEGNPMFYDSYFVDFNAFANSTIVNFDGNQGRFTVVPNPGYSGSLRFYVAVAPNTNFTTYDYQQYTFAVGDTPIVALATNFTAQAGQPFSNQTLATFTNGVPNSAATNFTATINWGDTSINNGVILTNATGRKEVRGTHSYTNAGHYPVQVTIRSSIGAEAVVTTTAIVPPALSLARLGATNRLQWPSWAAGYQLQLHTNLNTTPWTDVTNLPALSGYDTVLPRTNAASREFFRLKR